MAELGKLDVPHNVYKIPQADFSICQAVYGEPAIVLMSKKSPIPQEELNKPAGDLRSKVIRKRKEDFLVVPTLIPDALGIEPALTETQPSDVGMDIVSTIIPLTTSRGTMRIPLHTLNETGIFQKYHGRSESKSGSG